MKKSDKTERTFKIQIEKTISEEDIKNIIIDALESGSTYWIGLDNSEQKWDEQPEELATSEIVAKFILEGDTVKFYDIEDENIVWELNLQKLLNGFKLNAEQRPFDNDLENYDSTTSDCILQFALFDKVVYG